MKLSQVLSFLPFALALPSLHSLGHVDITITIDDGNNGLEKAFTTPSNLCLKVIFPPNPKCSDGWEPAPVGDTGFWTCCLSEKSSNNGLMVVQDKASSQRLVALPPCTKKCSECADVCDIETHECYNACIDSQVSRATQKGL